MRDGEEVRGETQLPHGLELVGEAVAQLAFVGTGCVGVAGRDRRFRLRPQHFEGIAVDTEARDLRHTRGADARIPLEIDDAGLGKRPRLGEEIVGS